MYCLGDFDIAETQVVVDENYNTVDIIKKLLAYASSNNFILIKTAFG